MFARNLSAAARSGFALRTRIRMAESLLLLKDEPDAVAAAAPARATADIEFVATHAIDQVEVYWRALASQGVESPGQDLGFIRLWTEALNISTADQFYLVALRAGRPLALLPLHRRQ